MTTDKNTILNGLKLVEDEPTDKLVFGFTKFANDLVCLLEDQKTPTPFMIAVHGEWGSGKTSLIKAVKSELDNKISSKEWKTLEFDAWEYEKTDIVTALLRHIKSTFEDKGDVVKSFANSVGHFILDSALRKTIGISERDAKSHFEQFIDTIPRIKENLENITNNSRLIVFVDDWDRCDIDNVLDMLEVIKMFLTAKGVIFVIAVDMTKIERAWHLRYKSETGLIEGREHVDKIFQLKLTLPPKDENEIKKYIETLTESLPDKERELLIDGLPRNPRKIKRVLNSLYFVIKNIDDYNDSKLPLIIICTIITGLYPDFAKIIIQEPRTLIQMASMGFALGSYEYVKDAFHTISEMKQNKSSLKSTFVHIDSSAVYPSTVDGFTYLILKQPEIFKILLAMGKFYDWKLSKTESDNKRTFVAYYNNYESKLKNIIYTSGLLG